MPWSQRIGLLALLLFQFLAAPVSAHEVRPAYLAIDQLAPTEYRILWKRPAQGGSVLNVAPKLSNGWLDAQPTTRTLAAGFEIAEWHVTAVENALEGQTLTIEGLDVTLTDTLVRISLLDGRRIDTVVKPQAPSLTLNFEPRGTLLIAGYLQLGIEHILSGIDHLLFLFGLLILVPNRWMLLKTVTAFTLAHSITLAAATLGLVTVAPALTETLIALSIAFLGIEILRAQRGSTSLTIRHTWIVAFGFGLLHGLGFASGLTILGLPQSDIPLALFSFNIGVEIGQLAFVGVIAAIATALTRLDLSRWPQLRLAPAYLVGVMGTFWAIQNSVRLLGLQ